MICMKTDFVKNEVLSSEILFLTIFMSWEKHKNKEVMEFSLMSQTTGSATCGKLI